MHDLAIISTIKSITPIEGKDRIVLANVENYNCIIAKEEFKEGDKVVYIFYDAILPEKPEFEFLRKRCWSEKYKGFRIRPMKLGGIISEGLVLPLSVLPEGNYKIGDVVTNTLGIRLYDPETLDVPPEKEIKRKGLLKILYRFKWFRSIMESYRKRSKLKDAEKNKYDSWTKESDEENIEKCYNRVKDSNETFIVSEKVEGCSFLASFKKGKFKVFSHHRRVYSGDWWDYAKWNHLEQKMKDYCNHKNIEGIAIAGELIGPKIQHNIYNRKDLELYLYGGYHLNGTPLSWTEILSLSERMNIPTVPFIREQFELESLDYMLKDCEGISLLYNVPREGLVYRSLDGMVHFKVKSRPYKIWFEKRDPIE